MPIFVSLGKKFPNLCVSLVKENHYFCKVNQRHFFIFAVFSKISHWNEVLIARSSDFLPLVCNYVTITNAFPSEQLTRLFRRYASINYSHKKNAYPKNWSEEKPINNTNILINSSRDSSQNSFLRLQFIPIQTKQQQQQKKKTREKMIIK